MKADEPYVLHILDAIAKIREFCKGTDRAGFAKDERTREAVVRKLEIIGEAANKVSPEFKLLHASIPWRGIIGQRNVIAHDYGDIKNEKVWLVAIEMIPNLASEVEKLIPKDPA